MLHVLDWLGNDMVFVRFEYPNDEMYNQLSNALFGINDTIKKRFDIPLIELPLLLEPYDDFIGDEARYFKIQLKKANLTVQLYDFDVIELRENWRQEWFTTCI